MKNDSVCGSFNNYIWCLNYYPTFFFLKPVTVRIILGDPGAVSRGRAKWRDKSFQEWAKEPLGTKSHRTISKRLREYRLLIGQKKSLVLFCRIGEQQLSNHFRVFLQSDCCPATCPCAAPIFKTKIINVKI